MSMLLARPGWNNPLLTKLLKCTVSTENHSNATIHHCSIPTTGNTLSPTKKPHILRLQKPPSSPRLRAAKRNICVRDRTQNWLSSCSFLSCPFCLLLFYSLDNMLDDCWVRKWPFIPFLFPFVCLFHTTVKQLHLPSTTKFKSWKHSQVYFLTTSELRLVVIGRMLALKGEDL